MITPLTGGHTPMITQLTATAPAYTWPRDRMGSLRESDCPAGRPLLARPALDSPPWTLPLVMLPPRMELLFMDGLRDRPPPPPPRRPMEEDTNTKLHGRRGNRGRSKQATIRTVIEQAVAAGRCTWIPKNMCIVKVR